MDGCRTSKVWELIEEIVALTVVVGATVFMTWMVTGAH
jgi:hypothetical protein